MKIFLILLISFVFAVQTNGQEYLGRKPVVRPIKPMAKPLKPLHMGGLVALQGGGLRALPMRIRKLIGSTKGGKVIIGGKDGFPRHGGAGPGENYANGLRNGWGGNPDLPVHQSVSAWTDPLGGLDFPRDYRGGELILDDNTGHYIAKSTAVGSGYGRRRRKPTKVLPGHDPLAVEGGHRIVKQVLHDAAATIDLGSHGELSRGNPFAEQAAEGLAREMVHVAGKKLGGAKGPLHLGPALHPNPVHPKPFHKPVIHDEIYPKPVHPKPLHPKPVFPVHKPVHPKPIHKPLHKAIHRPLHRSIHKPIHKAIHKPIHPKPIHPKPIHKPVVPVHQPLFPKHGLHKPVHPKPVVPIHKPVHKAPIHPKHPKGKVPPVLGGIGGGILALQGGGHHFGEDPAFIKNLIGSTLNGEIIVGGQGGFPRHGGAGRGEPFSNGLRNGWGGDPDAPVHTAVSSWSDPLDGRLFPTDYSGGDLILDDATGHYILKSQVGGKPPHHAVKAPGIAPVGPVHPVAGHHIAGMAPVGPVGQIVRQVVGGVASALGPVLDPITHDVVKSGSHIGAPHIGPIGKPIGGGDPVHNVHKVAKSGIVAAQHDPLAVEIGHKTATHIAGKASRTIDIATGGGVSHGDPYANNAALGLAREAAHVANKELSLASGAGHVPIGGIHAGIDIYGGRPGGHIAPKKKPVHVLPTGYGGRTRRRKVVAARAW